MDKLKAQLFLVWFLLVLFSVSVIGYLLVPSRMFDVVGIESTPVIDFMARAYGVLLLAFLPVVWSIKVREKSRYQEIILRSLGVYLVLSSAVDILAFTQDIVGSASIPSAVLRIFLGLMAFWLSRD